MNNTQEIRNNETMKQILADSFGGVMYKVANRDKYETTELLAKWDELSEGEKESMDGLINGAINFIKS